MDDLEVCLTEKVSSLVGIKANLPEMEREKALWAERTNYVCMAGNGE